MEEVAELRGFSRWYAQQVGLLDESYLDAGRPYGASRVLFEVDAAGSRVADLRRGLALDSGYLSRLLRRLEREGLVTLARDPADGRQRVVHLTDAGRREQQRLEERSEALAQRQLAGLPPRRRAEVATALGTAMRLLRAGGAVFEEVDPAGPEARAALDRYYAELDARFPTGFDPGDPSASAAGLRPPAGVFLLVRVEGEVVGCGGVQRVDDGTGEVKRMWIDPAWRGAGLARRLLDRLEEAARDLGRSRVVLDTNDTLTDAIALYESSGYRSVPRYNANPFAQRWYAKDL
jgi:DNA-binding MarR family transcriptional regulator/GNAT superfamily N-acetyltransferase